MLLASILYVRKIHFSRHLSRKTLPFTSRSIKFCSKYFYTSISLMYTIIWPNFLLVFVVVIDLTNFISLYNILHSFFQNNRYHFNIKKRCIIKCITKLYNGLAHQSGQNQNLSKKNQQGLLQLIIHRWIKKCKCKKIQYD